MSYGEWRKRGKGWSSLEIDSPWKHGLFEAYPLVEEETVNRMVREAEKLDVPVHENPSQLRFAIHAAKNGVRKYMPRMIAKMSAGCHETWVSFQDAEALLRWKQREIKETRDFEKKNPGLYEEGEADRDIQQKLEEMEEAIQEHIPTHIMGSAGMLPMGFTLLEPWRQDDTPRKEIKVGSRASEAQAEAQAEAEAVWMFV